MLRNVVIEVIIKQHKRYHYFSEHPPKQQISVYSDGSYFDKRRPIGWSYLIIDHSDRILHQNSGQDKQLNDSLGAELLAARNALNAAVERAPSSHITLFVDAQIIIEGLFQKFPKWQSNHWLNRSKQPVKHRHLWQELYELSQNYWVDWIWIKGHHTNPHNQQVDLLARQACLGITH
jgi:ribonuclease HI